MLDPSLIAPDTVRGIRRDEYERMVEAGLFEDERIELLRGALVARGQQGPRHAHVLTGLVTVFIERLGRQVDVRCQMPFAAGVDSVPEPDVAVLPAMDYSTLIPERAHLVVEVADSSLRKDRILKAELYAEAGVPEYWLVDLTHDTVEVRTLPADGKYTRTATLGAADTVQPAAFPDVVLAVREILHPS